MRDYSKYFLEGSSIKAGQGLKDYVLVLKSDQLIVKNVEVHYPGSRTGFTLTKGVLMALMTELANRMDDLETAGKLQ